MSGERALRYLRKVDVVPRLLVCIERQGEAGRVVENVPKLLPVDLWRVDGDIVVLAS